MDFMTVKEAVNTNKYYEKLMALSGLDELKETIKKWNNILQNLKSKDIDAPLLLPNLFLNARPGAGKTYVFRILSDYLDSAGFMDFYGDVKFFEFYFEYCPPGMFGPEISRLSEMLRHSAGFRNEFRGVVVVDITEWADKCEEDGFVRMLEFLSAIDEKACLIFTADNFTDLQIEKAEKVLNAFCRVRTVPFPYPSERAFAEYCARRVEKYKLKLDESAVDLIADSVKRLMESGYFYGYKTVNMLCLDMAFELSSSTVTRDNVTAEQLKAFSADSEFVERLYSSAKIRRIGFRG